MLNLKILMFQYYYFFQSEGRQNPLILFNTVNIAINCYTEFLLDRLVDLCVTQEKKYL